MNFYSEEVGPLFTVMSFVMLFFFSVGFVVLPFTFSHLFPLDFLFSTIFPLETTSPVFHLFLPTFNLCESLVPLLGPLTCLDTIFKTLSKVNSSENRIFFPKLNKKANGQCHCNCCVNITITFSFFPLILYSHRRL